MGTVKGWVALIVGASLLVTLSACEGSRHAEIMSTEDLRAKAEKALDPVAESEQAGVPFEGKPVESAGLSEPFDFAPEPPPIAGPSAAESKPGPSAAESKPGPSAVEPKPGPSAAESKPGPSAAESKPGPPAVEPVVEEIVPAKEPVPEPAMEIAKIQPDDFVSEAPEPEPEPAPSAEPEADSGLADVFFDFDEYAIRPDAVPVLEKDAELLKSTYKDSGVLIEGHCDERGTVEYNLELGKRRAQAVKNYLVDLGIEESRIRIVSYGKERPFCTESEPSCWKQNRRGHFVRQ